jgi:glycosyltransferase involved in cell wall biosynthesis
MRILFLSTRQAKPSFRFRVEQFLPWFEEQGHDCELGFLLGQPLSRLWLYRRLSGFDVVLLQKRLLSRGELFLVRRGARRLVYDLDDAVMLNAQGHPDQRRQGRFRAMAQAADLVICGNSYLAEQSRTFAKHVEVVPTTINAEQFHPRRKPARSGPVTIGWTGSRSTNSYLNEVLPAIASLGDGVRFKFLSDSDAGIDFRLLGNVPCQFVRWSPEVEISETATFDIGLMPLPDNPWTRGKCGFKALQYMGLGIPAVCSPVGVNTEIITHEKNGLLASSPEEWSRCLNRLMEDPDLRDRLGKAGRERIEQHYAAHVQVPRLIQLLEQLCQSKIRSA